MLRAEALGVVQRKMSHFEAALGPLYLQAENVGSRIRAGVKAYLVGRIV